MKEHDHGNPNTYRSTSHLYDLDDRPIVKDDIPFYLDYANRIGGDILEIACGTGRVTIPLARAGFNVTGLDLSSDMLERFREKLLNEEKKVKDRVTQLEADMTSFEMNKRFPFIMIPFRAFQLLTGDGQREACLRNVHRHLTDDGLFIVTAFKPYGLLDESWVQPEKEDWIREDSMTGITVRRTNSKRRIDLINQITYPELIYYVKDREGNISIYVEKLAMKYFYEEQLRELLQSAGFNIVDAFGYYDKRTISEGPELIFVCKRKENQNQ
jgi:SAM-dependent methyltransferase